MHNQQYKNIIILGLAGILLHEKYYLVQYFFNTLGAKNIFTIFILLVLFFCYRAYKYRLINRDESWLIEIVNSQFKTLTKYLNPIKNTHLSLLLGLDNIGKESLLKNNYQQIITAHEKVSISWWQKDNHLICCAAPRINKAQTALYSSRTWKKICKKIICRRLKQPFDQIIILTHIPALHKPHESTQARDIDQINTALFAILKYHFKTKCKIVFTQTDYIQGFKDTFINLDNDYHKQSWSIDFNNTLATIITKSYDTNFDSWSNRLNAKIYRSIKNAHNMETKEKIIEFPLQIQKLKQPIKNFISQLYLPSKNTISSIDFCSALQNNVEFNYLNNQTTTSKSSIFSIPFFCNSFNIDKKTNANNKFLGVLCITLIFMILLIKNYTTNLQNITSNLQSLAISNNLEDIGQKLEKIELLKNTNFITIMLNPKLKNSLSTIQESYNNQLQKTLTPFVQKTLVKTINNNHNELEKAKAANILQLFYAQTVSTHEQQILSNWLQAKLNYNNKPIILKLLKDLRTNMSNKYNLKLANNILSKLSINEKVVLQACQLQSFSIIPYTKFNIAQGFSLADFNSIIKTSIPNICKNKACQESSKKYYLQLYLAYWSDVLQHPEKILTDEAYIYKIKEIASYIENVLMAIKDTQQSLIIRNLYAQWLNLNFDSYIKYINNQSSINENINLIKTIDNNNNFNNRVDNIWQNQINKILKNNVYQATAIQIQTIWQQEILPSYEKIANIYPLDKSSTIDISLEEFSKFFAPNSKTSIFISNYIKPFANFKNTNWENNTPINFSEDFLNQLTLFTWIQKMFFKEDKLFLRLNLIPQKLQQNIKQIALQINNKKIDLFSGTEPAITITWPFLQPNPTSINIVDINNHQFYKITDGNWSLFKLIDSGKIYNSNNSKELILKLNIQNQPIKFRLIADNTINPFTFKIFENFKLPKNILN